jgi:N-acetylmuramoyl-L-alanine amidase
MSRTSLEHTWMPSPNFNQRSEGGSPDMLVLHYTGMESCAASLERLCSPEAQVSCHYAVDLDGAIIQMVAENDRAWHAGASNWCGVSDNNGRSIGIEIQNKGHEFGYHDFPTIQMEAVRALCGDILSRHEIPPRNIVGHSDIAPGRKLDPGERFDWKMLHENNIGHWVEPAPLVSGQFFQPGDSGEPITALQAMFSIYGYDVAMTGVYDDELRDVVHAFQQHWRQQKTDGIADVSTIKTLRMLIDALPQSPLRI